MHADARLARRRRRIMIRCVLPSDIQRVEPAVVEQVGGAINVRALLPGADHHPRAPVPGRLRERRAHLVSQEMPEIYLDLGLVAPKGAEIDVLALGFGWVGGCARHPRRENT